MPMPHPGLYRRIIPIQNGNETDFITKGGGAKCWTPAETPAPSGNGKGGSGTPAHYADPVGAHFTTEELLLLLDIDSIFLASIADWPRSEIRQAAGQYLQDRTISTSELVALAKKIRAVAKKYGITLPSGFEGAVY